MKGENSTLSGDTLTPTLSVNGEEAIFMVMTIRWPGRCRGDFEKTLVGQGRAVPVSRIWDPGPERNMSAMNPPPAMNTM